MASNALSREAQPLQELRVTLVRAESFQYRVDFHERQAAVVVDRRGPATQMRGPDHHDRRIPERSGMPARFGHRR